MLEKKVNGLERHLDRAGCDGMTNAAVPVAMRSAVSAMRSPMQRERVESSRAVDDGALLLVGLHPAAVDVARRWLEIGAERAQCSLNGFQYWHSGGCAPAALC